MDKSSVVPQKLNIKLPTHLTISLLFTKRTEKKKYLNHYSTQMQHYLKQLKGANNPNVHDPEGEGTGESLLNGYRTLFYGDDNVLELEMVVIHHCECTKCY